MMQSQRTATLSQLLDEDLVPGTPDITVSSLSSHASNVCSGGLFLACAGQRHHGLDYLDQAINCGAVAVFWEPAKDLNEPNFDVVNVPVTGLSQRVSDIAARFFDSPSQYIQVAGVTGTNGKTSTVKLIADALEILGCPCGLLGTLGFGTPGRLQTGSLTTPDAVTIQSTLADFRNANIEYTAMEVSSHGLAQHRVQGVGFNIAVFTNLTRDHLDYHGDIDTYADTKASLFSFPGLEAAIVNLSDGYGLKIWQHIPKSVKSIGVWLGDRDEFPAKYYVCAPNVVAGEHGTDIEFQSHWGDGKISSKLLGRFNANNLLSAAAVILQWGFELQKTLAALSQVKPVPGRMESFGGGGKPLVVVDYSHTPDALEKALLAIREHCRGHLYVVFGCGGERDPGKRPLMGAVASEFADYLIVTDDNPRNENPAQITRNILAGIPAGVHPTVEHDRAKAIAAAISLAGAKDAVLIAGKGHEDYQIRGRERLAFDDREHAKRLLQSAVGGSA